MSVGGGTHHCFVYGEKDYFISKKELTQFDKDEKVKDEIPWG
jgi:hypothetical protein